VQLSNDLIPTTTVEEHHEAFFVWGRAIQSGVLAAQGNTLLHVDEHSDSALPELRAPLPAVRDLDTLERFTYSELNIGNFIAPAIYLQWLTRVLWLKQHHEGGANWRMLSLCAKDQSELSFAGLYTADFNIPSGPRFRHAEFSCIDLDSAIRSDQPVVLDIDIDYFSSNDLPDLTDWSIEITAQAYNRYLNDPYDIPRLITGRRMLFEEKGGRFFMRFETNAAMLGPSVTRDVVAARLATFRKFLIEKSVVPAIIVICRSMISGYTRREHAGFIEAGVQEILDELYRTEKSHIRELLPGVKLSCAAD
jgi:hypothetical protein